MESITPVVAAIIITWIVSAMMPVTTTISVAEISVQASAISTVTVTMPAMAVASAVMMTAFVSLPAETSISAVSCFVNITAG